MRLFTGIDLPGEIVERLDRLISDLRPLARIKWSPAANLHITTKFIGQWPEERLLQLNQALAGLAARPPIAIQVRRLGFFPNPKSPRVFWAGIEAPAALHDLAHDIDQALENLGLAPEIRPYSPHLTLARIKEHAGLAALLEQIRRLEESGFGAFTVDRFHLYLSKPGPSGSVYTKLSEFPFST